MYADTANEMSRRLPKRRFGDDGAIAHSVKKRRLEDKNNKDAVIVPPTLATDTGSMYVTGHDGDMVLNLAAYLGMGLCMPDKCFPGGVGDETSEYLLKRVRRVEGKTGDIVLVELDWVDNDDSAYGYNRTYEINAERLIYATDFVLHRDPSPQQLQMIAPKPHKDAEERAKYAATIAVELVKVPTEKGPHDKYCLELVCRSLPLRGFIYFYRMAKDAISMRILPSKSHIDASSNPSGTL